MKIGTLFSGIGAPEQGAKRVYGDNLELVFACEYDKFARQSFNANYEIHTDCFHNDVREMDGTQYQGKVDVLVGGSPCQAFSIAGLRNGTDDERGQLIYQYIRIVDEVKAPVIIYENVKGMLSIKTLEYPNILNEEFLWQEISQNISSLSKITLGKYLLQKCAEYLTLKSVKSDISHIKKLALTSEKWENVVLIGAMKKLQSYLTQIKQIMKKQNLFQTEQTRLLECKEEDLDLILNLLNTMNLLSIKDINLSEEKKDTLEVKEDIRESIDLLLSNISEDLLKKAKLSIMSMEENWIIELKTYAYAMGKLNTLISIINLWKSSQSLWTEILSISISQISNIKSNSVFDEFVQALRDIGYYCHYEVVNTKHYGVPQNRERIFLVGFLDHEMYHRFQFAPKQKLAKRLKDVLEYEVDKKYYLNKPLELYNQESQGNTLIDIESECNTLIAGTHGYAQGYINDTNRISRTLRIGGGSSMSDKHCFDMVGVIGMLDIKGNDQTRRVYGTDGSAPCGYEIAEYGDSINLSVPNSKTRRGRVGKQVSQTLDTQCNQAVVQHRIRKLTTLECWRLQDFPDEAHNKAKESGVSDSQLYKQCGNSMSVNVLEMIFRQIEKAKEIEEGRLF